MEVQSLLWVLAVIAVVGMGYFILKGKKCRQELIKNHSCAYFLSSQEILTWEKMKKSYAQHSCKKQAATVILGDKSTANIFAAVKEHSCATCKKLFTEEEWENGGIIKQDGDNYHPTCLEKKFISAFKKTHGIK